MCEATVLVLAGFLDPVANQNGPGLTLIPITQGTATPVANEQTGEVPTAFVLHPAYPNPFSTGTTVRLDAAQASEVTVEVFDLLGCRVAVLADGPLEAGRHVLHWNAEGMASGVYPYGIRAEGVRQTQRSTVLR
ncbi:MAG: T9SS type A sorting domain-containing protein [Rhodothermaceae bacterium]|nr:T9SS type A sorting domain-containing protein [Rhodothermaceae bacterium]